jgi:hypothetical protein
LHVETKAGGKTRVYCYQRNQTDRCAQRSGTLDAIEWGIVAFLRTFRLPDEEAARILAIADDAATGYDDAERRRRELSGRLDRIRDMYKWGDLTHEAFQSERDHIEAELATLTGTRGQADVLADEATFLRDLPAAWDAATPERRNALARLVFQSVRVTDGRATAILPTPDFAPFFNAGNNNAAPDNEGGVNLQAERAEATGVGSAPSKPPRLP